MTESTQQQATSIDGLPVDTTTRYPLDAGRCEACGQYKTWKFKVQNKRSGKMMPGHVTAEGYKIGDGNCPKWARIAELNRKKAEKKAAEAAVPAAGAPREPGAWIRDVAGGCKVASVASSPSFAAAAVAATPSGPATGPASDNEIAFTVNGFTITTSVAQAASVVEQIGAALRQLLGAQGA
ncbi:MAG: hypothetical protein Q6365_002670 [Candidatus Sigynarchaeota archaeon]